MGSCTVPWSRLFLKWPCSANFCKSQIRSEGWHCRSNSLRISAIGWNLVGWCTVLDDEAGPYLKWPRSANVHIFWSRLAVLWISCLKLIWYSAWNNFLWKANDFSYFLFNSLVADVLVTKRNQGISNQGIDLFCQIGLSLFSIAAELNRWRAIRHPSVGGDWGLFKGGGHLQPCGWVLNTLRPRQNGRHFADDIFACIFFSENWLNFHWNMFARVQLTIIQHWVR